MLQSINMGRYITSYEKVKYCLLSAWIYLTDCDRNLYVLFFQELLKNPVTSQK